MKVPWLRIVGGLVGLTEVVRTIRGEPQTGRDRGQLARGIRGLGAIEARLAAAVVAALKEAFDRDHVRLELERAELEAQHRRAERALRLELLRQAGDREMARLRLLAGVALISWLATLLLARGGTVALGLRIGLGLGWVLLLAALAIALAAQSRVSRAAARLDDSASAGDIADAGSVAMAVPWLIVTGLGAICLATLLA